MEGLNWKKNTKVRILKADEVFTFYITFVGYDIQNVGRIFAKAWLQEPAKTF